MNVIRTFVDIIKHIKGNDLLTSYALAHLDGILEDKRTRIKTFQDVMTDFKTPMNIIEILNSFIQ